MKKSTTMFVCFFFFFKKIQILQKLNLGLTTTNVAIPIPENVNVPILENIHSPIPENIDVPIPRNIHSPIPENVDIPISENNHISQTQFQKVDLDILRDNDFWVFVLVDSLLILYGCVFEIFFFAYLRPPTPPKLEILGPSLALRVRGICLEEGGGN